jgi:hypothetical protein
MRERAITISEAGQFVCSADPVLGKKFFLSAGVRFLWITMRLPKIKEMPGKHKHV